MAKIKNTKELIMTYKTLYRKLKTEQHTNVMNPTKTGSELVCSGRESSTCSTIDTRRVTLVTSPVISHE